MRTQQKYLSPWLKVFEPIYFPNSKRHQKPILQHFKILSLEVTDKSEVATPDHALDLSALLSSTPTIKTALAIKTARPLEAAQNPAGSL